MHRNLLLRQRQARCLCAALLPCRLAVAASAAAAVGARRSVAVEQRLGVRAQQRARCGWQAVRTAALSLVRLLHKPEQRAAAGGG